MSPKTEIAAVLLLIHTVRGHRVILDSDLARLYGVRTSQLNQAFRRNRRRFPADFAFLLTREEGGRMLSQFVTASRKRNLAKPPIAYTEYGAMMAANVLNSKRAVIMSVEVVRAFISLRRAARSQGALSRKLGELAHAVNARLSRHDSEISALFETVEKLIGGEAEAPQKRIGFRLD